jgi:Uma2 family endonuclease
MAAPSVSHQRISRELIIQIGNFLRGKPCEVFAAPFDVRLFPQEDNRDDTVVQPDITVVCDSSKLANGKACKGAPDMVIEIISDSSILVDRTVKLEKYRAAGVREYWIVDPETLDALVSILEKGTYVSRLYQGRIPAAVLPGLTVDLA